MKQWFMKWKWFQLHSHDFGKVRAFVEIYEIEWCDTRDDIEMMFDFGKFGIFE